MIKEALDIEKAVFYIYHIRNPCTDWKTGLNLRGYYIREARKAIETFTNPFAISLLEDEIKKYQDEFISSAHNNTLQPYLK